MNETLNRLEQSILSSKDDFAMYTDDLLSLIELLREKQPQLNDNQQDVLEWCKWDYSDSYCQSVISNLYFYVKHEDFARRSQKITRKMVEAYKKLSDKEFAQVLEVFSKWVQEQEEE